MDTTTRHDCSGCGQPREWSGVALVGADGGLFGLVSCPDCCRVSSFTIRAVRDEGGWR